VHEQLRDAMGDAEFEAALDRNSTLTIDEIYQLISALPED